jgi:hypothetical protein
MTYNELLALGKIVVNATPSAPTAYSWGEDKFSYSTLNETFSQELNKLHKENPRQAYQLMEEVINDVLPKKVLEQYGQFADIKTFAQGDKPVFKQRITESSRRRAKQFITKVGLAGAYEVFKLDGKSYEVPTAAFGGAANIPYEEYLDGRIQMSDVLDVVLDTLDEKIYLEIEKALIAATANLQAANSHAEAGFNEKAMDKLLAVADSYGQSTIYCTFEFAATMLPETGWVSDEMRNARWNNGYLGNYKGHKVVVLQQSYEDETNEVKVIDPSYAWIIPGGADKPVKVAFEGTAHMRETQNEDWSTTTHIYQKVGVGAMITNDICVYQNTDLKKD